MISCQSIRIFLSSSAKLLVGALILSFLIIPEANSAVVAGYRDGNTKACLNGTYVQACVNTNGRFGAHTVGPVGTIWHDSPGSSGRIGFVADRARDNSWLDSDFFVPGSPLEGWGITADSTNYVFTNSSGSDASATFAFSDVNVTSSSAYLTHTTTIGSFTVAQTYTVGIGSGTFANDQRLGISVTVTNNGSAVNNFYYARHVDPDNLVYEGGGDFDTANKIESQYGVAGASYSLVSARETDTRNGQISFLGLISTDSRSKVSFGGFGLSTSDPMSDLVDPSSPTYSTTVGSWENSDNAISLVMDLGAISNGGSKTFELAYVLSADAAEDVVESAGESSSGSEDPNISFDYEYSEAPVGARLLVGAKHSDGRKATISIDSASASVCRMDGELVLMTARGTCIVVATVGSGVKRLYIQVYKTAYVYPLMGDSERPSARIEGSKITLTRGEYAMSDKSALTIRYLTATIMVDGVPFKTFIYNPESLVVPSYMHIWHSATVDSISSLAAMTTNLPDSAKGKKISIHEYVITLRDSSSGHGSLEYTFSG